MFYIYYFLYKITSPMRLDFNPGRLMYEYRPGRGFFIYFFGGLAAPSFCLFYFSGCRDESRTCDMYLTTSRRATSGLRRHPVPQFGA